MLAVLAFACGASYAYLLVEADFVSARNFSWSAQSALLVLFVAVTRALLETARDDTPWRRARLALCGARAPRARRLRRSTSSRIRPGGEPRPMTRVRAALRRAWTPRMEASEEDVMSVRIGDEAPNFKAQTTQGTIDFHEWIGDGYAVLFSHPKDFTPVCTTELGYLAHLAPEFEKRNTKVIGLSIDPVSDHERWAKDIEETQGTAPRYPIIGDEDLAVAKLYDMIHPNAAGGKRTAADNATIRSVFVIGPDKKVKLTLTYPMSTGRNFDEVAARDRLRSSSPRSTRSRQPVNWKQGEDVIIVPAVSDDEARAEVPRRLEVAAGRTSRIVPQPK